MLLQTTSKSKKNLTRGWLDRGGENEEVKEAKERDLEKEDRARGGKVFYSTSRR